MATRALVLGATGYVGGRLVPRLLATGWQVRCLVRSPAKAAGLPWSERCEIVAGDLLEAEGLAEAFEDVDVVFHLVHSMGSAASFAEADRRIARNVAEAAAAAGVRRVVYLGGLGELDAGSSEHLRSRAEVGEVLAAGPTPTTVLRAAVIIGSGSASFEMLRHLVERLPVMIAPRWVRTRCQPVAIRDVLAALVGVAAADDGVDHVYDIGGPDVVTYLGMMQAYARAAGLRSRVVLTVPLLTPRLSSLWIGLVTPVPTGVAKPLVGSLSQEVLVRPDGEDIAGVAPWEPLGFEEALASALRGVRDHEVDTSWRDAEPSDRGVAEPWPGDPDWAGGTLLADRAEARSAASPAALLAEVCRVGGDRGWPALGWAWTLRGLLDRAVGGVGLRRGRRDPETLRPGDALDFWRVERVGHDHGAGVLRLRAEMRLPGRAWLEWRVLPDGEGSVLRQRALFAPRGVGGRVYWWAMLPFHAMIFGAMCRALARHAEAPDA